MKLAEYKADKTKNIIFHLSRKYIVSPCLDIGAGNGSFMKLLKSEGYKVTGIDKYPAGKDVINCDALKLPYDEEFQTVFMTDFIEHVKETKIALKSAYRALKVGGHIIVITPENEDLKKSMVQCPFCNTEFHRNYHERSFTKLQLVKELLEAGFIIEKCRSVAMHFNEYMTGWPFTSIVSRFGRTKSLFAVGVKI